MRVCYLKRNFTFNTNVLNYKNYYQHNPFHASGPTKEEFDQHMVVHFGYRCPHCDYTSRTEGRLKRHIKDFHTDTENKQRAVPGRPKVYRCKQCDFSCTNKVIKYSYFDCQGFTPSSNVCARACVYVCVCECVCVQISEKSCLSVLFCFLIVFKT